MNPTSISLEERTCRAETQLLELEGRRILRKEFFPRHLAIIEAAARAIVNTGHFPTQAYDSSDEEVSAPAREEMDPDERMKLLRIIFDLFDTNRDGYWDMTETSQWLELVGKHCDLHTWEQFCESAKADPQQGLPIQAIDEWYEPDMLDEHISCVHNEDGTLDYQLAEIPEATLHKLDALLDAIFVFHLTTEPTASDTTESVHWEYEASSYWFQEFGWFRSFEDVNISDSHLQNGLSKDDVASIYNANEYLLEKHHSCLLSQKNGDNTFNADDDEDEKEYRPGGYHRVELGDVYHGHYEITKKLGWGNFSTVWLAHDTRTKCKSVALKIGKSKVNREMCDMEISALQKLNSHYESCNSEILKSFAERVVRMDDSFYIEGPHGRHLTMAIEPVGPDILKLLTAHEFVGVAPCIVKTLIKDMLEGLAFIHSVGLVHADIKPENVLIKTLDEEGVPFASDKISKLLGGTLYAEKPEEQELSNFMSEEYTCKISDFGSSRWIKPDESLQSQPLQTLEYRAPEVVLGCSITQSIDVWSVACTCFELLTGSFLFNPKCHDGPQALHHIRLFMCALGNFPESMITEDADSLYQSDFFTPTGEFLGNQILGEQFESSSLLEIFESHGANPEQAQDLYDFLSPMLELDSSKRATAEEASKHPWLVVTEKDAMPYTAPARSRLKKLVGIDYGDLDEDDDDDDVESDMSAVYPPTPPEPPKNLEAAFVEIDSNGAGHLEIMSTVSSKEYIILDLRQRAEYADLRREELVGRRLLRSDFFPTHLEAIKQTARIRA